MDGVGVYQWKEGDLYLGEYAKDKRHGYGVYSTAAASLFEGQYFAGQRDGYGVYCNSRGDVYQGMWHGNHKHGDGVLVSVCSSCPLLKITERRQRWQGALALFVAVV